MREKRKTLDKKSENLKLKKLAKKQKLQELGITLIALVVTIIILLILSGVTLNIALSDNGLFDKTKKAAEEYKTATDEEQRKIAMVEAAMNTENTEYEDKYGKKAMIPAGFAQTGIEGENTIDGGLVIIDSEGNEFVWIPVEDGNIENGKEEKLSDTVEWEKQEYEEMKKSVQEYKGFYIGRYEAGSTTERKGFQEKGNGTTKMVVQRDQYPYNYVGWGSYDENTKDYSKDVVTESDENNGKGAIYLCRHLYDGKSVGVKSTLCYKSQWNAMINFFRAHNQIREDNKVDWANVKGSEFLIERSEPKYLAVAYSADTKNQEHWEKAEGTSKSNLGYRILTTGASDWTKCLNIFDAIGNCWEMTMSLHVDRLLRVMVGSSATAETCNVSSYKIYESWGFNSGFRPTLYIVGS